MENELLTGEQLRDKVESLWLKHIKLCQDNFLYFVKEMWPDIIFKKKKINLSGPPSSYCK
jgi:hypothetical protein